MQPVYRGIMCMIAAQAMYVTIDAAVKLVDLDYPTSEIIFFRNFTGLILYMIYMATQRIPFTVNREKLSLHGSNGIASILGCLFIIHALKIGTLNEVITISFSVVFFVIILSYLFLKEHVSLQRWVATVIGFIGVVIALNPGKSIASSATVFALLSCPFNAFGMIKGKQLSEKATTTETLYFNLLITAVITAFALPFDQWLVPTNKDIGLFILMGAGASLGYTLVIKSYLSAPASIAGPMIYTAIVWSTLFDYFVWHEMPSRQLMIGSAVIIASGIYLIVQRTSPGEVSKELLKDSP